MKYFINLIFIFLSLTTITPALSKSENVSARRFAMIVGANDGGRWRVQLRYAKSDATSFLKVLKELGGVSPGDSRLITASSLKELEQTFNDMNRLLQSAKKTGVRLELVFYYSGHSDENGLLLGNDMMTYRELKKRLDNMPANVKIGILDSCASGALVRIKGGRRTAPFLVDTSTDITGTALITSSSADENSQESERVGASFFTHYFLSGLRGAADANGDGKVTLSESYAYAFDETLFRTESSRGGPQHANYDFQLSGTGDLVLTDLRTTSSMLEMEKDIQGRIFIRNQNKQLIAEINKLPNRTAQIALPPGNYEIKVDDFHYLYRSSVSIKPGRTAQLNKAMLNRTKAEPTTFRGSYPGWNETDLQYQALSATLVPGLSTNPQGRVLNNLSVNVIGSGYSLKGAEFGLLASRREYHAKGAQITPWGMNRTHHLTGAQIGVFNLARGETNGVQAGWVNLSNELTKGTQIGLVNLTASPGSGPQFGLINYMPGGMLSFATWTSDTALINTGVKLGGKYTYSMMAVSANLTYQDKWVAPVLGFGGHFESPVLPLWIETDLTASWLHKYENKEFLPASSNNINFLFTYRLGLGVRIKNVLSFYAGPTLNLLMTHGEDSKITSVAAFDAIKNWNYKNSSFELSPGFFAGFSIEPSFANANTLHTNKKSLLLLP